MLNNDQSNPDNRIHPGITNFLIPDSGIERPMVARRGSSQYCWPTSEWCAETLVIWIML